MKLFAAIFCAAGLLFMAIGVGAAGWQDYKIRHSAPVSATVLSTEVERHESHDSDGHDSTTYKPVVRFRYEVDGRSYTGSEVFPLSQSAGYGWAQSVVQRFHDGQTVDAWYNPNAAASAFLLREYLFLPYIFILFPTLFVAIGIGVALGAGASTTKPPLPIPSTENWNELKPTMRIADRKRAAWIAFLLWDTVGVLACGHYFLAARPHYETMALVATGIYFLIGIAPLALALYYGLLGRHIADARVFITGSSLTRGEDVTIGVRHAALAMLQIEEARISLICDATTRTQSGSKTTISTLTCYEDHVVALQKRHASAGERLEYAAKVTVPASAMPSTPRGEKGYPRYAWKIRVNVKIADGPDYRANFPVVVS